MPPADGPRFEFCLPEAHHHRATVHGIWDYRISGPRSMDDTATVLVFVQYGRTHSVRQFVYQVNLIGCSVSEGEVG